MAIDPNNLWVGMRLRHLAGDCWEIVMLEKDFCLAAYIGYDNGASMISYVEPKKGDRYNILHPRIYSADYELLDSALVGWVRRVRKEFGIHDHD